MPKINLPATQHPMIHTQIQRCKEKKKQKRGKEGEGEEEEELTGLLTLAFGGGRYRRSRGPRNT